MFKDMDYDFKLTKKQAEKLRDKLITKTMGDVHW